ncbi:MAG TPA: hypothetical protein VGN72_14300 [Tepidisphaeraceae bacterium]|jgi:hypothetical protein|nr:hypothetical protein [Tepidisphaeraceae bacterium]
MSNTAANWIMLLAATALSVAIVAVGLAVYFLLIRLTPLGVRVGRVLSGLWAAIQMNGRQMGDKLSQGAKVTEEWAAEQRRLRDAEREHGFPVLPVASEGEARWFRVRGVVRETEQEVDVMIDAQTAENASAKATIRGILVTDVSAVEPVGQS